MSAVNPFREIIERYPLGLLVVMAVAVVSSALVFLRGEGDRGELELWVFNIEHQELFQPVAKSWSLDPELPRVDVHLLEFQSLSRRMLSGFFSGTPVADLILGERSVASQAWRGPEEAIGFVDLTERLESEGLRERFNPPSFAPWTVDGRIYGLPMDVHPVMLAYRADLYEAAEIPIEEARTWDEFMEMSLPLIGDLTGNGVQDRFVLELPESDGNIAAMLILQAGGDLFDEKDRPALSGPVTVEVMTQLVYWSSRSPALTVDIPLFRGSGERLRGEGIVLAWLVPDWRAGRTMRNNPVLSGKMKLMPLPPWEEGGLRTSVWGGTMVGFPRANPNHENAWRFGKEILFNREVARNMWRNMMIISPVVDFWDDAVYDEPMPYYSDQAIGRLLIEMAGDVPYRSSSVYYPLAMTELANALNRLSREARRMGSPDRGTIRTMVERELDVAQDNVRRIVGRNIFQAPD